MTDILNIEFEDVCPSSFDAETAASAIFAQRGNHVSETLGKHDRYIMLKLEISQLCSFVNNG